MSMEKYFKKYEENSLKVQDQNVQALTVMHGKYNRWKAYQHVKTPGKDKPAFSLRATEGMFKEPGIRMTWCF